MNEMLDVPADIEQVATRIAGEYLSAPISCAKLYRDVVIALMAERERCALMVEGWGLSNGAAAIRACHASIAEGT